MNQKGGIEFLVLALVVIASFALVGGLTVINESAPQNPGQAVEIVQNDAQPQTHQSLQLQALKAITPVPSSQTDCPHDNGQVIINSGQQYDPNNSCLCLAWVIECKNHKCFKVDKEPDNKFGLLCNSLYDGWCSSGVYAPTNGTYCIGKPVIYLYPTKNTIVNVKVNTPGSIIESIPFYVDGGWNVLAHPNGTLDYDGKIYKEFYYESSVTKVNPPKQGFVVEKDKAEEKLKEITAKLGLIKPEQEEFLSYWLPKINNLNSPYLFISVIDKEEKDRIDNVEILPKPDTKIEFIVYFKPVYKPFSVSGLNLPSEPPKRIGFTSVEWGGTIDTNQ